MIKPAQQERCTRTSSLISPTKLGFLLLLAVGLAWSFAAVPQAGAADRSSRTPGKTPAKTAQAPAPIAAERIAACAALLAKLPEGIGRPAGDRRAWDQIGSAALRRDVLRRAEALRNVPLPEQPDELYLDFSRTGNRRNWERVALQRRGRLTALVLAECLENQGRFLPAVEALIEALASEKTWVMPAHDRRLTNFQGTFIDVDLASSALAWNLATADWMLGDRLASATRQRIRQQCERFVLAPCRAAYRGSRRLDGWMRTTNNWNAVCLAGVTGTALALVESTEERGLFVAAAEHFSKNFLAGFTPDGYCSEGLGYWNYGFGHFVMLAETVRQATGGKLDWLGWPEVAAPARFAANIEIQHGVSPAFADCAVVARPSGLLQWHLNRQFHLGLPDARFDPHQALGSLFEAALYLFPNSASSLPEPKAQRVRALRNWFEQAGVLVARPAPGGECRMGVALKGGHNAEHHNHNDVGSYVVVVGGVPVLLDPGGEVYTARTFSKDRYQSKLLNSFGHAVPVVAGQLQRTGRDAQAKVLRTDFTDAQDTLVLDLASAYAVPDLRRLERSFIYRRTGKGVLEIVDRAEFSRPQSLGTALITRGTWQRRGADVLQVTDGDEGVDVRFSGSGPLEARAEEIHEDAAVHPTRVGIELAPSTAAMISLQISPQSIPANKTQSARGR